LLLAAAYRSLTFERLKESVYLTARTSAMVCFCSIGSWTFSSVFAYLGGHEVIEHWVQVLERRRRCSSSSPTHHLPAGLAAGMDGDHHIFVPIFPAVAEKTFNIDPILFGILVSLNTRPRSIRRRWRWPRIT